MEPIRLIIGLGNPGREYDDTRHNAGYRWVDAIAARKKARWSRESKFSGWTTRVEEGGHDFRMLKPATYMNESGRSVAAFVRLSHRAGGDARRARRARPSARHRAAEEGRRHRRAQ